MSEARHAAILRWLSVAEPDAIILSCVESPLPGAVVLDRCLADVPIAWLAELAGHCQVRAAVEHCAQPDASRARLAELAAATPRVALDGGPGNGAPVRYTSPPARRRGLLGLGSTPTAPSGTLAQRLAAALAALPLHDGAESPAARLLVTADCTACGVCTRSCPHGALDLNVVDGVATLSHLLDSCQGDGACVAVCPEDAIVREGNHGWSSVGERPVTVLACLPVRRCATCRTLFPAPADVASDLCPVCRVKAADPFAVHLPPAARALLEHRRRQRPQG